MRIKHQVIVRSSYHDDVPVQASRHDPRGPTGPVLPFAQPGESGFVYFIQAGVDGPIKIGFSTSVQERIDALQTASPFPLVLLAAFEGSLKDEQALHRSLAAHRLRGEWFRDCPDVREAMNARVVPGRRPYTVRGEHCINCQTLLVVDEDMLCKACVEFMDDWATPEFKAAWREVRAA